MAQVDLRGGAGGVFARVGQRFLDGAVDGPLHGRRESVGKLRAQLGLDAAAVDQLLDVGEGGLRGEFRGPSPGRPQHADHVAQLVQGLDAQPPDRGRRLLDLRVTRADLECTGPYGDQADLVGHHVVHLTRKLRTLLGQDGLGSQHLLVVARFRDLRQSRRQVPPGLDELAQEDRGGRRRRRVAERDQCRGPRQVEGRCEQLRRRSNVTEREGQGAERQEDAVAAERGEGVQRDQAGEDRVREQDGGQGEQEGQEGQATAQEQGEGRGEAAGHAQRLLTVPVDPDVRQCDRHHGGVQQRWCTAPSPGGRLAGRAGPLGRGLPPRAW